MVGSERELHRAPRATCPWPDDEPIRDRGAARAAVPTRVASPWTRPLASSPRSPHLGDETVGLPEDALLRSSLDAARLGAGADNATFALADRVAGSAVVVASARDASGQLWGSRFLPGDGVAGHVLISRRPILVDDTRHAPVFRHIGSHPVRSIVALPVEAEGRTLGVLSLTSSRPRRFGHDRTEFLQAVAEQLATIVARTSRAPYLDRLRELAHDLSTPLTALRGFLHLAMEQEAPLPTAQRELLDLAAVAADQLVWLVGDMHDSMYLSSGRLELHLAPVDPIALARTALASCAPLAAETGQCLAFDWQPNVPTIRADRRRVERILGNILQNAMKFAPPGTTVRLGVQLDGPGLVRFTVDDKGPGFGEPDARHLAGVHLSGGTSRVAPTEGHGLGLRIARALAAAHGGRLVAANRPTGGARVALVLPIGAEGSEGRS